MNIPLRYADVNGEIRFIDAIPEEELKDCKCPACQQPLGVRRNKAKKYNSFAHKGKPSCKDGVLIVVSLLIYNIFKLNYHFTTPKGFMDFTNIRLFKEETMRFDDARFDEKYNSVFLKKGDKELMLLIHGDKSIPQEFKQSIFNANISCVQINLRNIYKKLGLQDHERITTDQFLKEILLGTAGKEWLNNQKINRFKDHLKSKYAVKKEIKRGKSRKAFVTDCPWKKKEWKTRDNKTIFYAEYSEHCRKCDYCIKSESDFFIARYCYCMAYHTTGKIKEFFNEYYKISKIDYTICR